MFSFFKKKPSSPDAVNTTPAAEAAAAPAPAPQTGPAPQDTPAENGSSSWWRKPFGGGATAKAAEDQPATQDFVAAPEPTAKPQAPNSRQNWMERLKAGLRKTGSSIATVFTGTQIDDRLYEELEDALLMADTGVKATQHLLEDLKRRVKETKTTEPAAVKALLADALTDLLRPLEKPLTIGEHTPTVIMVAGVNGAGKTTSIGKLTKHLADGEQSVLLAAADTFRAAAR
uniref:signal recognition particle receptor subunit alpha n=2 Tax=Comamonadaceae TaxID=80864 RepID=UPI00325FB5B6